MAVVLKPDSDKKIMREALALHVETHGKAGSFDSFVRSLKSHQKPRMHLIAFSFVNYRAF